MAGEVTFRSPLLPVQKAVFSRLSGSLSVPVYDYVPDTADAPYVVIGDDTISPWYSKTAGGVEVTTTVHTFSVYRGRKEVKSLMDTIGQSLTATSLNLAADDFAALPGVLEFADILIEDSPRGITYHGVQRFRFRIQDIS